MSWQAVEISPVLCATAACGGRPAGIIELNRCSAKYGSLVLCSRCEENHHAGRTTTSPNRRQSLRCLCLFHLPHGPQHLAAVPLLELAHRAEHFVHMPRPENREADWSQDCCSQ